MADELQGLTVKVGVTDDLFTQGIGKINKSMTLLQSEFRASSEGLKGFGSSTDQAGNKSQFLNKAIELQQAKVKALAESYAKSKTETGEFSNATMSAGTKVNNAVASLTKMQNELKQVDGELSKTNGEVKKISWKEKFASAGEGLESTKSKISGLKTAFMGVTATLAGGFGLMKFTEGAITAGDNAYKLSQKLHLTSKESAEMNRIFTITGTDSSAFSGTMVKLDKALEGAGEKGNATTKMLKDYGVTLTDSTGKLLPMNEQLGALSEAYKKASASGNEEAFTAEVLGNKGASLIPLLENYTEAKEQASKVKGIGIDPKEAHETEESLKVLKMQVSATSGVMAKAMIPVVQQILPPLITLFQNITTKVKENKVELDKLIQSTIGIGKSIGETIAPVLKEIFSFIAQHGEATKAIILGIGTAFLTLGAVRGTINGITGSMKLWEDAMKIKDKIGDLIGVIKNWEIVTKLQAVAQGALNLVMNANPIALIVIAIGALVAGIVVAYNKCEWFRNGINAIGTWLKTFFTVTLPNTFKTVITFFQNNWKQLLLLIVNPFAGAFALLYKHNDAFRQKINAFITAIKTAFINGWNAVVKFFTVSIPATLQKVAGWFVELPSKIMYGLGSLVGLLGTWGVSVWTYFSTNVPLWINNICTFFSELPNKIWVFLLEVGTKFAEWNVNTITWIANTVVIWITNIVTFFSELPSKIWEFLVSVVTKLGEWGGNVVSWISTNVSAWITSIVTFFSELPSKIWTWLVNVVTSIGTWGTNMLTTAKEEMGKVVTGIEDTFKNLPSKMLEIGKNIVLGIKDGIKNAWNGMTGWIGKLCGDFTQGVKDKFEIHSPSHIFRDEIGKMLAMGIGVGFEQEMPNINTNISKTLDGTVNIAQLDSLKNVDKAYSCNNKYEEKQPIYVIVNTDLKMDSKELANVLTTRVTKNITKDKKNKDISRGGKILYV